MTQRRSNRIPRVLCDALPQEKAPVMVSSEEAAHLQQVLRLREGDGVIALNGRGSEVSARIRHRDKALWLETDSTAPIQTRLFQAETTGLVLEMAILKGDAMSWVIEKAVELGVNKIVPVECDFGVVETSRKGSQHFVERWQRIADQALKQCERLHRLQVDPPLPLSQVLQQKVARRWVAVEPGAGFQEAQPIEFEYQPESLTHVLIGPEGGWSPAECTIFAAEIRMGNLLAATFGPLILRAETAAVFTMSQAMSHALATRT
ncbi:MAG: RsmE family RNA methyltransferase [Oligoflexia bacterium]